MATVEEDRPISSASSSSEEEVNKLMSQGKRHFVCSEIVEAVKCFQEACRLLGLKYGQTASECGDAYFHYGKSLLELARVENGVLGNALKEVDIDESDSDEETKLNTVGPKIKDIPPEEKKALKESVQCAMEEKAATTNGKGSTTAETNEGVSSAENKAGPSSAETNEGTSSAETNEGVSSAETNEGVSSAETNEGVSSAETNEGVSSAKNKAGTSSAETNEGVSSAKNKAGTSSAETDEGVSSAENKQGTTNFENEQRESSAEAKKEESSAETKKEVSTADAKEELPSAEAKEGALSAENKDTVPEEAAEKSKEETSEEKKEVDESMDVTEDGDNDKDDGGKDIAKDDGGKDITEDDGGEDITEDDGGEDIEDNCEENEKDKAPKEGEKAVTDGDGIATMQLSWEMLEFARIIFKRINNGESQLKLAQTRMLLAEIHMEQEQFEDAIIESTKCLNIQKILLQLDDRHLAETYYHLGLAYGLSVNYEESAKSYNSASEVLELRIKNIKERMENVEQHDKGKGKASDDDPHVKDRKELSELLDLLPEIKERCLDAKNENEKLRNNIREQMGLTTVGFGKSAAAGSSTSTAQPIEPKKADNINYLVRRTKRKPEEEEKTDQTSEMPPKKSRADDGGATTQAENGAMAPSEAAPMEQK